MTALLVLLTVIPGSIGDLLTAAGMKRHGEIKDWSGRGLLRLGRELARSPNIIVGIVCMAVAFFAMMALFSTTPLSFAAPVTAASNILDTIFAKYLLREDVEWHRWTGVSLVAIGIALISM
jgi:drug/metabolite transporter (DMT)-like permease